MKDARYFQLAAFIVALSCIDAHAQVTFTPLGDLPGGTFSSRAFGVSADGSVVAGQSNSSAGSFESFRWTASGGMVGLGDLPGGTFASSAWGVSADGDVVVGAGSSLSGAEAFRWTAGDGMVGLGYLPGGSSFSSAEDVSPDGSVIVGTSDSASGLEAFRWTADGGMLGLGDLPGGSFGSVVIAVSAAGDVVVGFGNLDEITSTTEAFRWTAGEGMVGLGDLPGGTFNSNTWDVSADGSVIVGYGNTALGEEAFRWTAGGGMQNPRELLIAGGATGLTDWRLTQATGVSADGSVIVGYGTNPLGRTEAWLAVLDEPAPLLPDYDASGLVEQADLDLVLLNWGSELADPVAAGWINDPPSGPVDQGELDKVLLNWGASTALSAASVPEPASWVLIGLDLFTGAFCIIVGHDRRFANADAD